MANTSPAAIAAAAKGAKSAKAAAPAADKTKRKQSPRRPASDVLTTLEQRLKDFDEKTAKKRKLITDHIDKLKNGPKPTVTKDEGVKALAQLSQGLPDGVDIFTKIKQEQAKLRALEKLAKAVTPEEIAEAQYELETGTATAGDEQEDGQEPGGEVEPPAAE